MQSQAAFDGLTLGKPIRFDVRNGGPRYVVQPQPDGSLKPIPLRRCAITVDGKEVPGAVAVNEAAGEVTCYVAEPAGSIRRWRIDREARCPVTEVRRGTVQVIVRDTP